VIFLS